MERDELMRELTELWPTIKEMVAEHTTRQAADPSRYRPYNKIFSVRLNQALIDELKAHAADHGISYSRLITEAVAEWLQRREGT